MPAYTLINTSKSRSVGLGPHVHRMPNLAIRLLTKVRVGLVSHAKECTYSSLARINTAETNDFCLSLRPLISLPAYLQLNVYHDTRSLQPAAI